MCVCVCVRGPAAVATCLVCIPLAYRRLAGTLNTQFRAFFLIPASQRIRLVGVKLACVSVSVCVCVTRSPTRTHTHAVPCCIALPHRR